MSAFHLLNVSPELSRAEIDVAYEDAGFNDRAPEGVLQKAVGALTASKPRLYEEVSYWWGIPLHKIDEFTHIENPDTGKILACEAIKTMPLLALTRANMAAYLCENKSIGNTNTFVDRLNTLIKEQKNIDTDDVGKMINHARKKSGVVPRDCARNPARSRHWRKTLAGLAVLLGYCFRRNDEYWVFCTVSEAGTQSNQYSYQNLAVIFNYQFSILNYQRQLPVDKQQRLY